MLIVVLADGRKPPRETGLAPLRRPDLLYFGTIRTPENMPIPMFGWGDEGARRRPRDPTARDAFGGCPPPNNNTVPRPGPPPQPGDWPN
eukprot:912872-Prymnesium_polylepis.1